MATSGRNSPIADWMNAHKDEVAKNSGKAIAVHPEMGIVAVSEDHQEVSKQVLALGLRDTALIYMVPPSYAQREKAAKLQALKDVVVLEAEKAVDHTPNLLPKSLIEAVSALKKSR